MSEKGMIPHQKAQGVVDKTALILMAFTFDEPEMDLREIARRVGLNKSTTCRILKSLMSYHLIEQNPATGLYRLGIRLFELGNMVADNLKLDEVIKPYLEELAAETGETSHFAIFDGSGIVHLVRVESPQAIRAVPCRLGERYPVHCLAVGKAICAYLPESEFQPLLSSEGLKKYTDATITSLSDFETQIHKVRERGYAIDDEEFINGIKCIAAPVLGYKGQVIGAINIVAPAVCLTAERATELVPQVLNVAKRISSYFSKNRASYIKVA